MQRRPVLPVLLLWEFFPQVKVYFGCRLGEGAKRNKKRCLPGMKAALLACSPLV
jgi:hypothetical protein